MKEFWREKRDGEVEDPVAEGDGRHQPLHSRHGDALAAVQMESHFDWAVPSIGLAQQLLRRLRERGTRAVRGNHNRSQSLNAHFKSLKHVEV